MSFLRLALFFVLGSAIHASSFTFTGQGDAGSHDLTFSISGDGFSYMFHTTEGPISVAACSAAPCDVTTTYPAGGPNPSSLHFQQSVSLLDVSAEIVSGSLVFSSTIKAIPVGGFGVTVPAQFGGEITALGPFDASSGQFPELFRVQLSAMGQATFSGIGAADGSAVLGGAHYEFSGTGTAEIAPVPEPGSMVLVGTALIWLLRKSGSAKY